LQSLLNPFGEVGSELMKLKIADPMLSIVEPMQPTLRRQPFSHPDWLFEPKWDGYRAICFVEKGNIRFVSRNKKSLTEKFPTLQPIVKEIRASGAVLDGEIVALGRDGMPSFGGLRSRRRDAGFLIVYYAFDLLYLDGRNLMNEPLLVRKRALKGILSKRVARQARYTDHVIGAGEDLFAELEKREFEGMVAKRSDSLYVGGRTQAWLKIKTEAGRDEIRRRSDAWHG
jgi:bifunctional non-homologous end joining protein LigD